MVQPRLHNKCDTLPIAAFETIHLSTYQPEFFTAYCRLSIFLEHYLMVCQYQQRKCLLENDVRVYKTLHEGISQYQKKLDEIWKKSRWISRIASEARAKRIKSVIESDFLSYYSIQCICCYSYRIRLPCHLDSLPDPPRPTHLLSFPPSSFEFWKHCSLDLSIRQQLSSS
ncbi:unnamed protein product [Haemonchus placei]|uniref:Uncharacterized protein n=1 Tax=Haemonchus placei TaxID=6290 RepID=A0A0N4VYB9_HAEPC|nr:unnamed protein product [Haemonchus placei]